MDEEGNDYGSMDVSEMDAPDYSLGGATKPEGLGTGNLGDYSLGSPLGAPSDEESATRFGDWGAYNYGDSTGPSGYLGGMFNAMPSVPNLANISQGLGTTPEQEKSNPLTSWLGNLFTFNPGSTGYGWGLRTPGTTAARDFFGTETPQERDIRMGKLNNVVRGIGAAMTPAPMSLAMAGYRGYKAYDEGASPSKALGIALGGAPGPLGAIGQVAQGNYGQALGKAVPGMGGQLAGLGVDAALGKDVTNPLATSLASYAGNQMGGPLGGMLAGGMMKASLEAPNKQTGAAMAQPSFLDSLKETLGVTTPQQQTAQSPQSLQRPSFGVGDILGGLAGLYSANQSGQAARGANEQNQSALQGQIASLSNMYGPNSPYAAQLRQSLERKDAASGRNSQYGPREAQLQALLAQQQAGNAGTIGNLSNMASNQQNASNLAEQQARNQQLGILMGLGKSSGAFDWAGGQLKDLYNQFSTPSQDSNPYEGMYPNTQDLYNT